MTAAEALPAAGRWRAVEQVMGLPVSVVLRGRHAGDDVARAAWTTLVAELRDLEDLFTTWRPDSPVSRLARGEIAVDDLPPAQAALVREVLALGEQARRESDGAFDVHRPDAAGVRVLDPSGVVKGWALQRVARHLHALPDTDSCLGGGGDLVCHVVREDAEPWRIGVEDPADPDRLVATVPLSRGAIATSGLTHRGAHVVDARTGRVPSVVASVTVVAADLTTADVDATAALALDADAVAWLRSRGRTGLVVGVDGSVEVIGPSA